MLRSLYTAATVVGAVHWSGCFEGPVFNDQAVTACAIQRAVAMVM